LHHVPLTFFWCSLSLTAVSTKGCRVAWRYSSSSGAVTDGFLDRPKATRWRASPEEEERRKEETRWERYGVLRIVAG
jgi:hypothetical protein